MGKTVSPQKKAEWNRRAKLKDAIVPLFFEVFPNKVILNCGNCNMEFSRTLIKNRDEPVYVCPNENCQARNWVPITFAK